MSKIHMATQEHLAILRMNGDREWLGQAGYVLQSNSSRSYWLEVGSIPLESVRLGLPTLANDLNPVANLLLLATVMASDFRNRAFGRIQVDIR